MLAATHSFGSQSQFNPIPSICRQFFGNSKVQYQYWALVRMSNVPGPFSICFQVQSYLRLFCLTLHYAYGIMPPTDVDGNEYIRCGTSANAGW
jgi:hypothetical protein